MKQTGLGKGLGSLIPQDFDTSLLAAPGERIEQIAIDKLTPNPEQPRTVFDETALRELATSIKRYGIIQPLVVSPGKVGYHLIAGERRWRAAGLSGLKTVPAIVRTTKQHEKLELAILENVQRVQLSSLEQATSIERLHAQFSLTYGEIARRLGKAETTVNNIVRLLQLPKSARDALEHKKITDGHARQILALKDLPDEQEKLLDSILTEGWSVRQAERYVAAVKAGAPAKKQATERVSGDTPETERLSKRFNAKVRIHRTAKGGRVEIAFTSDDQLAALLSELDR